MEIRILADAGNAKDEAQKAKVLAEMQGDMEKLSTEQLRQFLELLRTAFPNKARK